MRPVRSPPKFAISDGFQTSILLQFDHMANGFILYLAVVSGRYLPLVQLAKTSANGRWP
jgi:hypothetical protein